MSRSYLLPVLVFTRQNWSHIVTQPTHRKIDADVGDQIVRMARGTRLTASEIFRKIEEHSPFEGWTPLLATVQRMVKDYRSEDNPKDALGEYQQVALWSLADGNGEDAKNILGSVSPRP